MFVHGDTDYIVIHRVGPVYTSYRCTFDGTLEANPNNHTPPAPPVDMSVLIIMAYCLVPVIVACRLYIV